jgi:hypothetical protein
VVLTRQGKKSKPGYVSLMVPGVAVKAREHIAKAREVEGEDFANAIEARVSRDGPCHHVTAATPDETKKLGKRLHEFAYRVKEVADMKPGSLVKVTGTTGGKKAVPSEAWRLMVTSDQIQEIRAEFDLPPKDDLHVTLGFSPAGDVRKVEKTDVLG